MKFYCVEFEDCGFHSKKLDIDLYESLTCPCCYSPLLMYEDDRVPDALKIFSRSEQTDDDSPEEDT